MCGIIGMFHCKDVKEKLEKGLEAMKNRGNDASHFHIEGDHGIGHNLLAIVNKVPQPFKNKFIANCEIYNWKELQKRYNVEGRNDAETIFHIIENEGIESIKDFDGVFALTYWNEEVILARDIPIIPHIILRNLVN